MKIDKVLVSDLEVENFEEDCIIVSWNGHCTSDFYISIPVLVEEHSESLKSRYLDWVGSLGMTEVGGIRLVELLKIRDNLSYWWMSLISEKCNYAQSPHITDAVRMMAFEIWANANLQAKFLELHSDNIKLAECMKIWCFARGIKFSWVHSPEAKLQLLSIFRLHKVLLPPIRAWGWLLKYCVDRWPLRGVGISEWTNLHGDITFFSYFCNLSLIQKKNSAFHSNYWTRLPDILSKHHLKANWLHIYIKDSMHPSARSAARKIEYLNAGNNEAHVTLDAFLNVKTISKTLHDWFRIFKLKKKITTTVKNTKSDGLDLYPLFKDEWVETLSGSNLISNCLYVNLFEMAISKLSNQNIGIYLFEQQPWEFALTSAWKGANHKNLIGFQHTTVPFWDLRYFFGQSVYKDAKNLLLPMPDIVAVNGPISRKIFSDAGFPNGALAEVEALRYLHLNDKTVNVEKKSRDFNQPLKILVLADYKLGNIDSQLKLLDSAKILCSFDTEVVLKPHPVFANFNSYSYPGYIEVTNKSLEILLKRCDLVFTSAVTSAAVEAYLAGIPVISIRDPKSLNLSPLRGVSGVYFVGDKEELLNALSDIRMSDNTWPVNKDVFFHLDLDLRRWMSLISTFINL
jgi:surface carbohydrate biosynthesis protein (TIGR04326 family)